MSGDILLFLLGKFLFKVDVHYSQVSDDFDIDRNYYDAMKTREKTSKNLNCSKLNETS